MFFETNLGGGGGSVPYEIKDYTTPTSGNTTIDFDFVPSKVICVENYNGTIQGSMRFLENTIKHNVRWGVSSMATDTASLQISLTETSGGCTITIPRVTTASEYAGKAAICIAFR